MIKTVPGIRAKPHSQLFNSEVSDIISAPVSLKTPGCQGLLGGRVFCWSFSLNGVPSGKSFLTRKRAVKAARKAGNKNFKATRTV